MTLDPMDLLLWLATGAISGWLAGLITRGQGFGLDGNIAVGVVGAFLGHWLFSKFGVLTNVGFAGSIIVALVGALLLLLAIHLIRNAT